MIRNEGFSACAMCAKQTDQKRYGTGASQKHFEPVICYYNVIRTPCKGAYLQGKSMPGANAEPADGEKMTTIRDVAAACGVSPMTVSLVLNNRGRVSDVTRERVMQAVRELDYRPGATEANSSRGPMNVVGVMTGSEGTSLTRPGYFNSVLNGLLAATDAHQQHVILFARTHLLMDPYASIRQYCDGRCDGLIVLGPYQGSPLLAAIHQRGFPTVLIGASEMETISCVDLDNVGGGRQITLYLLEMGHRRIGFISGPDFVLSCLLRHKGYRQALDQWGVEADPDLEIMNNIWQKEGAAQLRTMLELPADRRPTAIFAWNDGAAKDAIQLAQGLGLRVPGDLSVVGIDDDPQSAEWLPPITTLRQPYHLIGAAAVEILLEEIRGETAEIKHRLFPGNLIVRKSAGPPGS